jgi:hypothetical protein
MQSTKTEIPSEISFRQNPIKIDRGNARNLIVELSLLYGESSCAPLRSAVGPGEIHQGSPERRLRCCAFEVVREPSMELLEAGYAWGEHDD